MLGVTIVFTIPAAMGILQEDDLPFLAKGVLAGIVTIPLGLLVGGIVAGMELFTTGTLDIFVSWCADQCGYIATGIIPKFAGCTTGGYWFIERGQWADNNYVPQPGDIIFFDWDNDGVEGERDHVGIVEKVEYGYVYTIEGNIGDACVRRAYPIGWYEIDGYGLPAYP